MANYAFIYSQLSYTSIIWGADSKRLAKGVIALQKTLGNKSDE